MKIRASLRRAMQCDGVGVWLPDADGRQMQLHGQDFPDSKGFAQEKMHLPSAGSVLGVVWQTGQPRVVDRANVAQLGPEGFRLAVAEGIQSICFLPLMSPHRTLGVLSLGRRQENAFIPEEVDFLGQVASQVAIHVGLGPAAAHWAAGCARVGARAGDDRGQC